MREFGRVEPAAPTGELAHVGWDGRNRSMFEYREVCGCSWTEDRSARLRVCTACYARAYREQCRLVERRDR